MIKQIPSYPLVLLHGWGFSSRIWQPLILALQQRGIDDVFALDLPGFGSAFHEPCESLEMLVDFIVEQLPEKCYLAGWSLGGMLAVQIAMRFPDKVAGIITIGSNLYFTQDNDWPGMPREDYEQFCARFSAQPQKTWQRFLALQTRGDVAQAQADQQLALLADFSDIQSRTATALLGILGQIDNRAVLPALPMRGLHIFGGADAITPGAVAGLLAQDHKQHVQVIDGASHALPVAHTQPVAATMVDFMVDFLRGKNDQAIDKSRIARSFSRAAISYDAAATLQRDVASALLATVPATCNGRVADIGCGTGYVTGQLLQKNAQVIAVDIAAGMVQHTHQRYPAVHCIQADMECLPLADQSVDWLLSSLAAQWASNLSRCFREWRRVLAAGGHLRFATFLPGTLRELEQSWRAVDDGVHVNRFIAEDVLVAALRAAGFLQIETVTATHTLYYPQLRHLARELKAIGAHNMNDGQPAGLTGRKRWQQLQSAYEQHRHSRGLPATYEVLYVAAV